MRRDSESFEPVARLKENMDAIRILKTLKEESRPATDDERDRLARYSGWGGLQEAFDPRRRHGSDSFAKAARELAEIVPKTWSDDAYKSMRDTVLNAHYTGYDIIQFMWSALAKMGLKAGDRVLDPSAGTGHFAGLRHPDVHMTQIEIDTITAEINAQLYPRDAVANLPFEEAVVPDNSFVASISNIPFGAYGVYERRYDKERDLPPLLIHDFFFIKALDKVAPGGVVAFITSKGTMDKVDNRVRRAIHDRGGDLIAGFRLPTDAFKAMANTEVTTDILFFQKRGPGQDANPHAVDPNLWIDTVEMPLSTGEKTSINRYFDNKFTHVLGRFDEAHYRYRRDLRVVDDRQQGETMDGFLARKLQDMLSRIPEGILNGVERSVDYVEADGISAPEEVPDGSGFTIPAGSYVVEGNKVGVLVGGVLRQPEQPIPARKQKLLLDAVPVRDAALEVLRLQAENAPEADYLEARERLNLLYDKFVGKHGPMTPHIQRISEDPSISTMLSLESFDADTQTAVKADLFSVRTISPPQPVTRADTPREALVYSMAYRGCVDPKLMVSLLGRPWDDIVKELDGEMFLDPDSGEWETKGRYLSGQVNLKIEAAKRALKTNPAMQANIEALEAVKPERLTVDEIGISLGAHWIDAEIQNDFAFELLRIGRFNAADAALYYDPALSEWRNQGNLSLVNYTPSDAETNWGTQHCKAADLFLDAINLREPTVRFKIDDQTYIDQKATSTARQVVRRIREEFGEWIKRDPSRVIRIENNYNERMRGLVERKFDGSYLRFEGLAANITLKDSQKNAVARGVEDGNALIAHAVGGGKSAIMAALAVETKRMGLVNKTMVVVPKNLLFQMPAEIKKFFPAARVLIVTQSDLKKENRQSFLYKVAANDWDMVVITKDAFAKIPLSPERVQAYLDRELSSIDKSIMALGGSVDNGTDGSVKRGVRALKSKRARIVKRIDGVAAKADKNSIYFEQLGVDQLCVDEAQYYKNLAADTNMRNVAGIGTSSSQRAEDMAMKAEYVRSIHGGRRGMITCTATPISNSMGEMYTLMNLTDPSKFDEVGIDSFDAWVRSFADTIQSLEQDPSGQSWRYVTRLASFKNVPEMINLFRSVADIKTAADLNLPRPVAEPITVTCPVDNAQKLMKKTLAIRASNLSSRPEKGSDNILVVGTDFRLGMLDMRLFSDRFPENPKGRVAMAAENILAEYHASTDRLGTQIVFSDFSSPRGHSQSEAPEGTFSVPEAIRDKLVAGGIPREQIAFIKDAKNDDERQLIHQRVRAGKVRVVFGSTDTMGVGTNVQTRMVAEHDLDAPHRPTDVEQRNGRIVRQGNTNSSVRIYTYTTEGFTREYESLKVKADFIKQAFRDPNSIGRRIDEDTGDKWAEIMALTTDNPIIKEKAVVDSRLAQLNAEREAFRSRMGMVRSKERMLTQSVESSQAGLTSLREFVGKLGDQVAESPYVIIDGEPYGKTTTAGAALMKRLESQRFFDPYGGTHTVMIGSHRGLEFSISRASFADSLGVLTIHGADKVNVHLSTSAEGAITSLRNQVSKMLDTLDVRERDLADKQAQLEEVKKQMAELNATGFPKEAEYQAAEAESARINAELVSVVKEFSAEAARQDPEMIEMTKILNRRGKWMLPPHLLGLEPEPEDNIMISDKETVGIDTDTDESADQFVAPGVG